MRNAKFLFISAVTFLLSACASVPKESVVLSQEVGIGLKKQYQSEVDLVNLHFSSKREQLNDAFQKSMNSYFEELTPDDSITLTKSQFQDVSGYITELNKKYNERKEDLEQLRLLLLKKLHENYLALDQANASLTALLQSEVDVKNATDDAYNKLSEATGNSIDLNSVLSKVDRFTIEAGSESEKIKDLIDSLKHSSNNR